MLAARIERDSSWFDLDLIAEIEEALGRGRASGATFGHVEPFPDYELNALIVRSDHAIYEKWGRGDLPGVDAYLDSLAEAFHLVHVDTLFRDWSVVEFRYPLRIPSLVSIYERSSAIRVAEPNGYFGDGDRIWAFEKSGAWNFVFSKGEGDCPSGCISRGFPTWKFRTEAAAGSSRRFPCAERAEYESALQVRLSDEDADVRASAARALAQLQD